VIGVFPRSYSALHFDSPNVTCPGVMKFCRFACWTSRSSHVTYSTSRSSLHISLYLNHVDPPLSRVTCLPILTTISNPHIPAPNAFSGPPLAAEPSSAAAGTGVFSHLKNGTGKTNWKAHVLVGSGEGLKATVPVARAGKKS
jgi:hypothetical protein